ncbi:MAG: FAD-dependent oxidoreductase [Pseudomonadota bacterium]
MPQPPTIVVIGAVAAGMSAASQAKRRRKDAQVIVLEQGQDVSYGACGMPYNIGDAGRSPEDLNVISPRAFREKRGLDLRLGHRVERLDPAARRVHGRTVEGEEFTVAYDELVLATGARPAPPPIPGIELPGVFPLRQLQDARDIKAWLAERAPARAVIVGGSYLGLELAEAMHARGLAVTLVKRSPALLPQLPDSMDALLRAELEAHGVRLLHGEPVRCVQAAGEGLEVLVGEEILPADLVLLATGYRPNAEIGLEAGLEAGPAGAIAVDAHGRTSDPHVWAAGDCADAFHGLTGERVWAPRALRANRTGRIVGGNVLGAAQPIPDSLGTAGLQVFGLEVATTGFSEVQARAAGFDPVTETIKARSRAHAYPGGRDIHVHLVADKASGRLLGGALVGAEWAALRIDVVAAALHHGATVAELADYDLVYSPPFAPAWDPLLTCANQLAKAVGN